MIAAHDWTGTCERPILNVEVCEFVKRRLTANGREGVALSVRAVEYFYARMENEPGKAYELLARLAAEDINLLVSALFHSAPVTLSLPFSRNGARTFKRSLPNWDGRSPDHNTPS